VKKATWDYAQGRTNQFEQDVENLIRCGVGTVLVNSPDEETTPSFQRMRGQGDRHVRGETPDRQGRARV